MQTKEQKHDDLIVFVFGFRLIKAQKKNNYSTHLKVFNILPKLLPKKPHPEKIKSTSYSCDEFVHSLTC